MNFLPEMEGGILSYKVHLIKPEPEIYQLLLKRYGLKAEESVFLDDTLKTAKITAFYMAKSHVFVFFRKNCQQSTPSLRSSSSACSLVAK